MPKLSVKFKLTVLWVAVIVLLFSAGNAKIIAYAEFVPSQAETSQAPVDKPEDGLKLVADSLEKSPVEEVVQDEANPAEEPTVVSANSASEPEQEPVSKVADNVEAPDTKPDPPDVVAEPAPEKNEPVEETEVEPAPAPPVSYVWGSARTIHFQTKVSVTNNGDAVSENIRVMLPMLENNSPYQTTTLTATNYSVTSKDGRVSTFNIGNLQPGESTQIIVDYSITLKPVSIKSTNSTVEKARQAFDQYTGQGNCLELTTAFVNRCRALGVQARIVNGFTRPQRRDITAGSLQGFRHSWGEFYVEGLGWVPADLTFGYFAELPYASHVVETYKDLSISVKYSGGKLSASWTNAIL